MFFNDEKMIVVLLLMLTNTGKGNADWSITFETPDICALKGSSVEFECFYDYPEEEVVNKYRWYKGEMNEGTYTRNELSLLPSYQNRTEYRGDRHHNCNLTLHDVEENDTGYYYFRFDTNHYGRQSYTSIYLIVTELHAKVYPQSVKAGDYVNLECETSCHLPSIIWFRDGVPVPTTNFQVHASDAGEYTCTLEAYESMPSNSVTLDVSYTILNVSVKMSHTGLLKPGGSVSLTCSTATKTAADVYTWYRKDASNSSHPIQVGSEQMLSFTSVEASLGGFYFCHVKSQEGMGRSSDVLLTVNEQSSRNRIIFIGSGIIVILLLIVLLIVYSACKKKNKSTACTEDEENNSRDYENVFVTKSVSKQREI